MISHTHLFERRLSPKTWARLILSFLFFCVRWNLPDFKVDNVCVCVHVDHSLTNWLQTVYTLMMVVSGNSIVCWSITRTRAENLVASKPKLTNNYELQKWNKQTNANFRREKWAKKFCDQQVDFKTSTKKAFNWKSAYENTKHKNGNSVK